VPLANYGSRVRASFRGAKRRLPPPARRSGVAACGHVWPIRPVLPFLSLSIMGEGSVL